MAQEVRLPQLGESVTEATITAWLAKEGDRVTEDQPLFEISTDKVDTEVPSPASGVLREIRAAVDDTIEVGEVVAVIAAEDEAEAAAPAPEQEPPSGAEEAEAPPPGTRAVKEEAADEGAVAATTEPERATTEDQVRPAPGDGQAREALLSPIVRRLIREHDLDPARIEGTGKGGRITREDVERAIERGPAPAPERPAAREAPPTQPAARPAAAAAAGAVSGKKPHETVAGRTEKLTRIRAAISRAMWESLQTTAQLTAAREVDMTRVMAVRDRAKGAFRSREGVSLSPLPFVARAVCMVLPRHEALNASIDPDAGVAKYYDTINLGIAVDAPQGLIVPNIKNAEDLTIPALARAIVDLAERVRSRKLNPDDVQGGTFTITNTGSRGVLFDTPVLNPPETGILATPVIEKRPVVVAQDGADAIAIRHMTYLCLTYDHRMVDGADAARFLADLAEVLETHDWEQEVAAYT